MRTENSCNHKEKKVIVHVFFLNISHLISIKIFVQPTDEMTPTCTLWKVFWFFATFFASYAKQDPFDFYFLLNLRPSCILISDSLEKVNNGLKIGAKIILKSHEPSVQSNAKFLTSIILDEHEMLWTTNIFPFCF